MKAMKRKIVKWVSVVMLSAVIVLGGAVVPAKIASAAANAGCSHNNATVSAKIIYPHATASGHEAALCDHYCCNVCHAEWNENITTLRWESHTVVGNYCVNCGYYMNSAAR